jgi:hypothetical protein
MRAQNKAPDELMPYSEHAAATATYAMINAFESMAAGLWAVEQRQVEEAKARFLATMERMRQDNTFYNQHLTVESDGGGR